ncbi:MAG: methylamine utilization protein [Proteobacteria bacterium]|nr:MAG: methylamine utilization protein [Pseudomonadota bacterium]
MPVTVALADGAPLAGAIVVAEPSGPAPRPKGAPEAIIDQRDLAFVPDVLVVRTGTAVSFPNSDKVRHQVYSFSGAKQFKLGLYSGKAHPPVVFDRPGVVTVGCNIHDGMIAHILVTDSPWFGRTGEHGELRLTGLPDGSYTLRIWHPRITDEPARLERVVEVAEARTGTQSFLLTRKLKPEAHRHGTDQRWDDY